MVLTHLCSKCSIVQDCIDRVFDAPNEVFCCPCYSSLKEYAERSRSHDTNNRMS